MSLVGVCRELNDLARDPDSRILSGLVVSFVQFVVLYSELSPVCRHIAQVAVAGSGCGCTVLFALTSP